MKRTIIALMCLAALLCLTLSASAEPAMTHGGYTAYLGANNYLYLQFPDGSVRHMPKAVADIVAMTDTVLYCTDTDGRFMSISLDGSNSDYIDVTQEQIDEYKAAQPYTLENNALTVSDNSTTDTAISATAILACANTDTLFWLESGIDGSTTLKSLQLDVAGAAIQTVGKGVTAPLSMIATDETVTMVAGDHSVTVVTLLDRRQATYPAASTLTTHAVSVGNQLIRYTLDAPTGHFTTEENIQTISALSAIATNEPVYSLGTSVPTVTPTVRPAVTATVRPATTAKPSSSSSSSTTSAALSKGDKGSSVRKMQKRLAELGYPVGTVDGVWGDDTQLAVNLFQFACGYTERKYITSGALDKLYGKNAPAYDPYLPLKQGKKGTPVLIMQSTLAIMGYKPGKLDGVYGKDTTAAVSLFQKVAGLKVTGEADRSTLQKLYSLDCPMNPSVYPPATPTPAPTDAPTNAPTNAPIDIQTVTIIDYKTKAPLTTSPNPGDVLTVSVQPSNAKFTCVWHYYGSTEALPNGTSLTYTVTKDDLGKKLVCTVTGIDGFTGKVTSIDAVIATSTDLKK